MKGEFLIAAVAALFLMLAGAIGDAPVAGGPAGRAPAAHSLAAGLPLVPAQTAVALAMEGSPEAPAALTVITFNIRTSGGQRR